MSLGIEQESHFLKIKKKSLLHKELYYRRELNIIDHYFCLIINYYYLFVALIIFENSFESLFVSRLKVKEIAEAIASQITTQAISLRCFDFSTLQKAEHNRDLAFITTQMPNYYR